ncbi:RNA polymerase subunit sigma [Vulcanibacillus modesticaldus]|uniref:RNA polymerase subunit sigma n=1 Tax=Vulcanibacillus modesticaldus TaxID=337097 RepID=A0A1D2YXW6_9BACI|nr:FliA/WhiG family RNA polymerase sigma factor [Vulcanibacillus modesticaldus]OEG00426.1 RNA polymerase subunit sigma [Vulcanibacillus modesticaldus]
MESLKQVNVNQLWQLWREYDDSDAYQQLVDKYIGLVDQVVKKMKVNLSSQVTFDELKSSGMLGFIDALKKFDYKRGLQFETYASLRIRGAIIDGLRENDWVPRSIREKAKKIENAYQILEQKFLRSVTDEEIMKFLKMDRQEFYQSLQETSFMHLLSLDEPIDEDRENTRRALITDSGETIDDKLDRQHLKEILAAAIERLPEKEKLIVTLYYYEELNLTEISEILGLSTSRISQLHTKAIYRLRGALGRQKKNLF